jgi:plastocyanin
MARTKIILAATLSLLCGNALLAGDIIGTVHAEPKAGAETSGETGGNNYDSRKYKFVERVDYAQMRDFVVSIEGPVGTNAPATNVLAVTTSSVAQKAATFSPHILPIMVGTTVEWPNNDDIYHNVFSDSDAARFDLGLYKGNPPEKRVRFNKPGKVDVYCSIHAAMHCVVLVMDNPYFAITDADGKFAITNVPPGAYTLKVWHERMPADEHQIVVPQTGVVKTNLTLTIKNLPAY